MNILFQSFLFRGYNVKFLKYGSLANYSLRCISDPDLKTNDNIFSVCMYMFTCRRFKFSPSNDNIVKNAIMKEQSNYNMLIIHFFHQSVLNCVLMKHSICLKNTPILILICPRQTMDLQISDVDVVAKWSSVLTIRSSWWGGQLSPGNDQRWNIPRDVGQLRIVVRMNIRLRFNNWLLVAETMGTFA